MHPRAVDKVRRTLLESERRPVIPERVDLGIHIEHIEPETADSLVKPDCQDVDDLISDCGILPVQIRLLRRKEMQIKFIRITDLLPCRAGE